jgi:catechol 2,3-dioxygenase-like lactoylglutathione lyase family enzyme
MESGTKQSIRLLHRRWLFQSELSADSPRRSQGETAVRRREQSRRGFCCRRQGCSSGSRNQSYRVSVEDLAEVNRRLPSLKPAITPVASPAHGRYEEQRFLDPEVNDIELSQRVWDPGAEKKASLAGHVAFSAADPDRLAEFYRFALDMKTVGRLDSKETDTTAVYLSDENMNMALVKNSPIAKRGVQLLGIKVPSIKHVGERLKQSAEYLYPGEPLITLRERSASSPYKTVYFKGPDGDEIDVSEEGWDL